VLVSAVFTAFKFSASDRSKFIGKEWLSENSLKLTRGGGIGEFLMLADLARDADERRRLFINAESFILVDDTVMGKLLIGFDNWLTCKCSELEVRIDGFVSWFGFMVELLAFGKNISFCECTLLLL
jgi:hypothetical protein